VSDAYREEPGRDCAVCGERGDPATFFHAARGLVCASCHAIDKHADKHRNITRDRAVDAALNGLLGGATGLAALIFSVNPGTFVTFAIAKVFCAAAAIAIVTCFRAFRFTERTPRRRLWMGFAIFGAVSAVVALGVFAANLVG
jgi:uncharacterized membrane protein HdeD (DUF308 family)